MLIYYICVMTCQRRKINFKAKKLSESFAGSENMYTFAVVKQTHPISEA